MMSIGWPRTKKTIYVVLLCVALLASGFAIYNQFASDSNANSLATQVSQACTTNRDLAITQGLNCQQAKDVKDNNAPVLVQGAKGDRGDTGAQGVQGVQGIQGVKGDKGDKGDTGSQGSSGVTGTNGTDGESIEGPKGATGDVGPQGAQGEQGVKGDTGDPGPKGEPGETWKPVSSDFADDGNGRCVYRVTWQSSSDNTTTTDAPTNPAMCV